ncbi:hypothetical protein D9M68_499230 [compost metagenome]
MSAFPNAVTINCSAGAGYTRFIELSLPNSRSANEALGSFSSRPGEIPHVGGALHPALK